jgi:EmrB/QacA subfamily drug resistance transporter
MKTEGPEIPNGSQTSKKAALLVATLSSFFTPFMGASVGVALPSIGKEFSLDAITLSWIATSFLLATAVFIVPFGRLADIYGRKKIFTFGIIIFTISCLLIAISPSAPFLIASRVVQGIGGAMLAGTAMAIISSVYPVKERGKALGFQIGAVYAGLSMGPFIGGLLTQHFGWRSIFWFSFPLGVITTIAVIWRLKSEWAEAKGERFDFIGSLIYGGALISLMYGFSRLPQIEGMWLIILGIVAISAFTWWERRVTSPVLNVRLFSKNVVFALSNLAALINYSATSATAFLLSLYLQYIKGLSPRDAGLVLVVQPVVMAILAPMAGRLSDKIDPRTLASIGMAITTGGLVLLIFINIGTGLGYIIVTLIIQGIGFGLFSSPNSNAVMSSVEKKTYGVASGTLGTMRVIGQMFSLGIATLLFALYMGQVQITPEYHASFIQATRTGFLVFSILCFGGIFASMARGKTR